MCVYSNMGPAYDPIIPFPTPWEPFKIQPLTPQVPWGPVPSTGQEISAENLKALLDAFHKAVDAAKAADKASGQPDCTDPDKIKLEERVAELERRLAATEAAKPAPKNRAKRAKKAKP